MGSTDVPLFVLKMGIDPKVYNLIKFLFLRVPVLVSAIYLMINYWGETDPLRIVGSFFTFIIVWRSSLSVYRRCILPPKYPKSYGKWAVITGATSGIGKEFATRLAREGMSILLVSRTKSKLEEQKIELKNEFDTIDVDYAVFDFTQSGAAEKTFYKSLDIQLSKLDQDGGIGMLVNNVGTTNEIPMNLDEFDDTLMDSILHCNVHSVVGMTRCVYKFMKNKGNGCIIAVSSGSGNHPTPMLAAYSATKAFMTQFIRSMAVEAWDTGVDFHVVTPYYIGGTSLYKRAKGTLVAPLPSKLIDGTLAQLGKKFVYQSHGYWFHGLLANLAAYYWGTTARWKKIMQDNRARADARAAKYKSE